VSTSCAGALLPVAWSRSDGQRQGGAVRPALERRWDDALASFDARTGMGAGSVGRADTVEEISELVREPRSEATALVRGKWLFGRLA